jgi:hypothetical protein
LFSVERKSAKSGAFVIVAVCVLAVSIVAAEASYAQLSGPSQASPSGRPKPHSNHIPQHGGIFFMALDNEHHLEGVLLKSGVFRVYLYDAFTRPLSASEVQQAIGNVQVGESESAPSIPLLVGKDGHTLEAALSKNLELPVTINLSLRFQQSGQNVRPEVFTFPFSHYIAADAHPQPPVPMDARLLILFIYFCIFLGGGIAILIVRDRMVVQADRWLPDDGKIRGTLWSRSRLKRGEMFRLWRVHRRFFPNSSLRFSYVALWVLTLSWLFLGLNLLQR